MNSAEELATKTRAALDAMLRKLDEQIAAIELSEIPKPGTPVDDSVPTLESLEVQVEQLCTQRAVNMREQHRWMVEAERAIRESDDVRAKDALARHAKHLRLAQEADAQLAEFRLLITEMRQLLSKPTDSSTV